MENFELFELYERGGGERGSLFQPLVKVMFSMDGWLSFLIRYSYIREMWNLQWSAEVRVVGWFNLGWVNCTSMNTLSYPRQERMWDSDSSSNHHLGLITCVLGSSSWKSPTCEPGFRWSGRVLVLKQCPTNFTAKYFWTVATIVNVALKNRSTTAFVPANTACQLPVGRQSSNYHMKYCLNLLVHSCKFIGVVVIRVK